ncbi:MAG: hypothetical protein A2583_14185 [Bdellovibrionales bacterium RIFOXYD1_FULL_53_11]|nr:MAG: hypothetical protein A2583_14185 [Bdellovibrionales bacterium RIFOXYD1_FULL_53_11]
MTARGVKSVLCTVPVICHRTRFTINADIINLIRYASKKGYEVDYYDVNALRPQELELRKYFESVKPDVVGISGAVSSGYYQVKQLVLVVRETCPDALIVLGGNIAASANVILRKTAVNICALGYGEKTWVHLLDYVKNNGTKLSFDKLDAVRGLAWLDADGELVFTGYGEKLPHEEELYQPDYGIIKSGLQDKSELIEKFFTSFKTRPEFMSDARSYDKGRKTRVATVWTTRGCVSRCTFCQRYLKGMQNYDLGRMEQYFVELKQKYDAGFIFLDDECFGYPNENALEIAKLLHKHGFLWAIEGLKCDTFERKYFKIFKELGCTSICIGSESGSQKILDVMEKKVSVDDIVKCYEYVMENNLRYSGNFCLGMPGETDQTVMDSAGMSAHIGIMGSIPPQEIFGFTYAKPFPGTPLYEYFQLVGGIGSSVEEEENYLLSLSGREMDQYTYVNLTGSSDKKAHFWGSLFKYEANRLYYNSKQRDRVRRRTFFESCKLARELVSNHVSRDKPFIVNIARVAFHFILILNDFLSGASSPLVTRMPRFILYGFMRNLVYYDAIIKNRLKNICGRFANKSEEARSNDFWYFKGKSFVMRSRPGALPRIDSLRRINRDLKAGLPVPKSLTEKNCRLIREGQ